jgi:hypothetical protein
MAAASITCSQLSPILQERGAYKGDYRPGTLREKLFGRSRLLPPSHPVGAYRPPATAVVE